METFSLPVPPTMQTVFVYAAILGLVFICLSAMTIRERRIASVALGAGDNARLLIRIRAHANFAEYVPIALFLMAGAALADMPSWFIHACGVTLITGRLIHIGAIYVADIHLRIIGMTATLTVIGAECLAILAQTVS